MEHTGPRITHFLIGDGKPRGSGPRVTINHRGIVMEDGVLPDVGAVKAGTIISVKKEVSQGDVLHYLRGEKKLVHKALGHMAFVSFCRRDVCGEIQKEIDEFRRQR